MTERDEARARDDQPPLLGDVYAGFPRLFSESSCEQVTPSKVINLRSSVCHGTYAVQANLVAEAILARLGIR